MGNEQNALRIDNAEEYLEDMNKRREMLLTAFSEQAKEAFLTGFVLLEHPLTEMNTATVSGEDLTNCILFSDENTEKQIVIQLKSIMAVVKYLIPLMIAAEMLKEMIEHTGEWSSNSYEIDLIDKLLEIKQQLVEKGLISLTSEAVGVEEELS